MFNALTAVKFVTAGVVGIGTGKIVSSVIKNNVAAPDSIFDKVSMISASWVIGGIVSTATKKFTNEMIDDTYQAGVTIVEKFKLDAKLGRINRHESTFEQEGLKPSDFVSDDNGKWSPIKNADGETVAS